MTTECIMELNWLCKHMKKGQKKPTTHSCTELNKTVFPCEYRLKIKINMLKEYLLKKKYVLQITLKGSQTWPWISGNLLRFAIRDSRLLNSRNIFMKQKLIWKSYFLSQEHRCLLAFLLPSFLTHLLNGSKLPCNGSQGKTVFLTFFTSR